MYRKEDLQKSYKNILDIYRGYLDLGIDHRKQVKASYQPHWDQMEKSYQYFKILYKLKNPQTAWATEHEVVYEHQTLRLLHFSGNRLDPNKRPMLVLPPQAGHHSNLADYSVSQSLVRVFQRYGYDTYVCQWLSAASEYKDLGIADFIRLTDEAVEAIRERTGYYKIHLMGQCQGGWQAAIYTALYQDKIANLATAAAPIDVNAEPSQIVKMAQNLPIDFFETLVSLGNGLMDGKYILTGFKNMQSEEHYVNKYYRLWDMIQKGDQDGINRFIHFENWYEYTQYLPGKFYLEIIQNIFKDNKLTRPGALVIDGRGVDLRNITCPVIILAGEKDHITPPEQAFALKNYISTRREDVVEILTKGGHIGTLMGTEALREDWTAVAEVLELSI